MTDHSRRFELHRNIDDTGVSGTGIVADGAIWPDGTVSMKWRGEHGSYVNWVNLTDARHIHGHDGNTVFVFLDEE